MSGLAPYDVVGGLCVYLPSPSGLDVVLCPVGFIRDQLDTVRWQADVSLPSMTLQNAVRAPWNFK